MIVEETVVNAPEVAFEMGMHKDGAFEMGNAIRELLDQQPKVKFSDLEVGKVYTYKTYNNQVIYQVHKVTPSGKQVDVSRYGENEIHRIYSGSFTCDFILLNEVLISFLGVTHKMVVREAVNRGLNVPAKVRREHPELFVEIPDRFAFDKDGKLEDRVKTALHPYMKFNPITSDDVDQILNEANVSLAELMDWGMKQKALNPKVESHYDRAFENFRNTIDFYVWLKELVSPGGIFYVEDNLQGA